ncbi:MAG: bifunctional serine/threonine-protein kinase/formylglycine-generating enzyme family protein [Microcystaceae cyanobacterium]
MLEKMMRIMVGQQIGSYHLDKLIGVGGFGGVFEASERVRNVIVKKVALKIIPDNSDAQLSELLAAREFENLNLVRSYNAGECKIMKMEMLYLAMELAQGSLDKWIEKGIFSKDTDEVILITQQVAQGLSYLHWKDKVHRDLKPANILKVDKQWKLSDFGLIRQLNSQTHIETTNVGGTIAYMPPEAFKGEISSAWDMWSLGIMLVEIITGNLPYEFKDRNQLLARVTNGDLKLPTLPQEFEALILGCLQQERRKRWTAQQVLKELEARVKVYPQGSGSSHPPQPKNFTETLPNGVKLKMMAIPAGSFMMGSNDYDNQKPIHQVALQSFYMGKYPITQAQYQAVMGNNPSYFKNAAKAPLSQGGWGVHPVEIVSWNDAQEFCRKLSKMTGKTYQLPSESQWEYACRAGSKSKWCFGDNEGQLGEYAWYSENSNHQTHPVGEKKPNNWGLYDLHGNVWEWCEDDYVDNYNNAPSDGTVYKNHSLKYYALRGGSYGYDPYACRSAYRNYGPCDLRNLYIGFRIIYNCDKTLNGVHSGVTIYHQGTVSSPPPKQKNFTETLPNGVKLEMMEIPAGNFMMGSNDYEEHKPIHQVTLQAFYMGKYPITQTQYQAVMGNNPSYFKNAAKAPLSQGGWGDYPVETVSWNDAQEFCRKLSKITGKIYQLPSEAQWEYACRAGSQGKWCFGDNEGQLGDYAWYYSNSNGQTHAVGQKKPNNWKLYDMHGNVWEWCEDDYVDNYTNTPSDGTAYKNQLLQYHILRGGSYGLNPDNCRSAHRNFDTCNARIDFFGFRIVCGVGKTS